MPGLYDTNINNPPYPKRMYSSDGGSVLVINAAEEAALGKGWSQNEPPPPPLPAPPEPEPVPTSKKK